ncbi:hypothetical protein [Intestinibacter sp.]|uniref:hypothetical protein n=1 Tax=Intestinibacter sp. TaxID=1965304 RepID=UPI003F136AEC
MDKVTERVERGIFVDFKGEKHYITVVGIRKEVNNGVTLSIGVSICAPEDEYNEEIGTNLAYDRATNSEPIFTASNKKDINCAYIDAILKSEIEYIKQRPQKYLRDYWSKYEKYRKEIELLDDAEYPIYKYEDAYNFFIKNPKEYIKWKKAVEFQLRKRGCHI